MEEGYDTLGPHPWSPVMRIPVHQDFADFVSALSRMQCGSSTPAPCWRDDTQYRVADAPIIHKGRGLVSWLDQPRLDFKTRQTDSAPVVAGLRQKRQRLDVHPFQNERWFVHVGGPNR